jgi:hypothetical protein
LAVGKRHPLGLIEGATENVAVAQADRRSVRTGLDPKVCRLFIVTAPRR